MSIKPGLRVSQSQRLTLTPSLRQSLAVLALSSAELDRLIDAEVEENPLLVSERPQSHSDGGDYQLALDTVSHKASVAEQLRAQILLSHAPQTVQALAIYLAHDLDERGYLDDTADEISAAHNLDPAIVSAAIELLQSCEPAGIGARNLAECLDLQLKNLGEPALTRALIIENLDCFAQRDWRKLAGVSGMQQAEIMRLATLLGNLTPNPADSISPPMTEILYPEVRVFRHDDGTLAVEMTRSTAQSLSIDRYLLMASKQHDTPRFRALDEYATRASALMEAIEARAKTVLRIAHAIVETQHRFFSKDGGDLKPLTQRALAERLNLHPSTITRAVANKSLDCQQGIFPFRFFFSSGIKMRDGETPLSSQVIRQRIHHLIATESPDHILSDERITAILRQSGVDIARRTVAKYRQCQKIPSSSQRRKSKRSL